VAVDGDRLEGNVRGAGEMLLGIFIRWQHIDQLRAIHDWLPQLREPDALRH